MESDLAEDKQSSTDTKKTAMLDDANIQDAIVTESTKGELQQRPRLSPVTLILQSEGLDDWRKIIGKIRVDKQALRRKCSIVAFERLLKSGHGIDTILEFLGDRVLNQRGARNLTFFVAHCLEASKVEEMQVLCKWVARQLYVGRYSNSALLTILQSLSNVRHQDQWPMVLDGFCKHVVEALRLSPVVHVEYLEPKTWSSFVGVLFHDSTSEEMVDTGLNFLEWSSTTQLNRLGELIWPIIEHWILSWNPSGSGKSNPVALTTKIIQLLQLLPLPRLVETVTSISWRFLDTTTSKEDFHTLWQQHSIWWSAVRSPEAFPYIRKSESWLEIVCELQKRQDEDVASTIEMEIQKQLEEGNVRAAHRTFLRNPQVSLDQCPRLAEALILDSEEHAKAALELARTRQHTAFLDAQGTGESSPLKQLRQDRINLLERMALAYAKMPYTRPSFAFRCVYDCWSLHKQDKLGPIKPGIALALVENGIYRPLQSGRRLVSEARLEWILQQVAEAEGKEVMSKLAATVWQWRDDTIRQMEYQRNTKRREAIEQQWRERSVMPRATSHWDILDSSASVGEKVSLRSQDFLERPSIDHDQMPFSAPLKHGGQTQQIEAVPAYRSIPEQLSFWSPTLETDREDIQHDKSMGGFPEIDSSSARTSEKSVQESLEAAHIGQETLAQQHETSNDMASKPTVVFQALRATRQRYATLVDSSTSLDSASKLAAVENPSPRCTKQPGLASTLEALLQRLNSAAHVASQSTVMLDSGPSTEALSELGPIPPCSLGAAIAAGARVGDLTSGGQDEKGLMIRRVVGTGPVYGVRDAEEPSTLATVMQPALGPGSAVDLSVREGK